MKVFPCLALISPSLLRCRLSRVALLILPSMVHIAQNVRPKFRPAILTPSSSAEVLLKLNETSLSQLPPDHETGHLEHKISKASK